MIKARKASNAKLDYSHITVCDLFAIQVFVLSMLSSGKIIAKLLTSLIRLHRIVLVLSMYSSIDFKFAGHY